MAARINALTGMAAGELATSIARGEISAHEAVEAHIERIEAVNPALNAVVVSRYDEARQEARNIDAQRRRGEALPPLAGVPVTIKECLDMAGTASTFGLPSRQHLLADKDDVYVARLRSAGAIVLGKTNVSQLLLHAECDNPVYGRTNNPWDPQRTSGGSSGGEGAIIAAGGSCLGLGTDIGGSVRYPAAFCGIVSLKPTSGRVPDFGCYSMPAGQQAIASQMGVLARRVADVALGLQIIEGDRSAAGPPAIADYRRIDPGELRVGWYDDDGSFPVSPAVRRAVSLAVAALRDCGARVVEWNPPDVPYAQQLYLGLLTADGGELLRALLGGDQRDPRIAQLLLLAGRSRPTLALLESLLRLAGQSYSASSLRPMGHRDTAHYWRLVQQLTAYRERFAAAMDSDGLDIIVCPATSLPAWTHGAGKDLLAGGAYTLLYNLLGFPAGVVPVTRVQPEEERDRPASRDRVLQRARQVDLDSAGLPIAVQVAARPWQEHLVLAAMSAFESAAREQIDYPRTP